MKTKDYQTNIIMRMIDMLGKVDNIIYTATSRNHYSISLFFDDIDRDERNIYTIEDEFNTVEHRILTDYDKDKKRWKKDLSCNRYELNTKQGFRKLQTAVERMIKEQNQFGVLPYPVAFYYRNRAI